MNLSNEVLEASLLKTFEGIPSALAAYSGGVDSTLVSVGAFKKLGKTFKAVIADSPSLPRQELLEAKEVAALFGFELLVVGTKETQDPLYLNNPKNRCYFCKSHLYQELKNLKQQFEVHSLINGANLDDLGDYRPGALAAKEENIRSPLIEAKFTKEHVRQLAKFWGLPNWDKPAMPCLASRVPYGEKIDLTKLKMIEDGESYLRAMGFPIVRVRHHGDLARIEILPELFQKLLLGKDTIEREFRKIGFKLIALDLNGFRSGSLNL